MGAGGPRDQPLQELTSCTYPTVVQTDSSRSKIKPVIRRGGPLAIDLDDQNPIRCGL
jgi:hypothetical protein